MSTFTPYYALLELVISFLTILLEILLTMIPCMTYLKRFYTLFLLCSMVLTTSGQSYANRSLLDMRADQTRKFAAWQMGKRLELKPLALCKVPSLYLANMSFMGTIIQDESWQGEPRYGLYAFNESTPDLHCAYHDRQGVMYSEFGGCAIGDYFYNVILYTDNLGNTYSCMNVFNLSTMEWDVDKSFTGNDTAVDYSQLSWTNTPYDKSTGLAYGYFFGEDDNKLVLGSIDYTKVKTSGKGLQPDRISKTDKTFMALAIDDRDGHLYGIDSQGSLYGIDKTNGNLSFIGATGVVPSFLHQAADIDTNTGKIYWMFVDRDMRCGLATVDISDATTTICYDFGRMVQFGDFFIVETDVLDDAPAQVTELSWKMHDGDAQKVDLSFVMPQQTNNGSALQQQQIQYIIMLDDNVLAKGDALSGQLVEVTLDNLPQGQLSHLTVMAENNVGKGDVAYIDVWAGNDYFATPTNVTLSVDGNSATLSWDAVNSSAHGGYVEMSGLEYHVWLVQMDGKKEVAVTSQLDCSIEIDPEKFDVIMMGVSASGPDGSWQSDVALANSVQVGEHAVPPLSFHFKDKDFVSGWWQVVDANEDGRTWSFDDDNSRMTIPNPEDETYPGQNDDWLVTVPLYMEEGLQYSLVLSGSFDNVEVRACADGSDEWMMVTAAQGTGDALFNGSVAGKFTPTTSGAYRLAICETGARNDVYVSAFSISEGVKVAAPKDVENLAVTPAPLGEKKAVISFKAPTTSISDYPLDAISYIELACNGQSIASLRNISPGQEVSFVDEVNVSGMYVYSVRVISADGVGGWQEASAWVGVDEPVEPQDVCIEDLHDGRYSIQWRTPEVGVHGGYVDVDSVRHFIYDVVDGKPSALVAVVEQGDSYVGQHDFNGEPGWFQMAVSAACPKDKEQQQPEVPDGAISIFDGSNAGTVPENVINDGSEVLANGAYAWEEEDYVESEAVVVSLIKGTPLALPFAESFAGKSIGASLFWWSKMLVGSSDWLLSDMSSDDDGGSMAFSPQQQGDKAVSGTSKISLQGAYHPTLLFWYHADEGAGGKLSVEVDHGQQRNSVSRVEEIALDEQHADGEWHLAVVDLSPYLDSDYVIVSFVAEDVKPDAVVAFDNVSIIDNNPNDLSVDILAPLEVFTGQEAEMIIKVTNNDYNASNTPSGPFTVTLRALYVENGETMDVVLLEAEEDELMPNGAYKDFAAHFTSTPFTSGIITLKAEVHYGEDPDVGNNIMEVAMAARQNDVPAIEDLTALVDKDMVTLNWTTPDYDTDEIAYRVYVDGTCLSTLEGRMESAVIGPLADGAHDIYVTVLYGEGRVESPLSNLATITTKIGRLTTDGDISDLDVIVYGIDGSVIADGVGAASRLPRGIYVIREKSSGTVKSIAVK